MVDIIGVEKKYGRKTVLRDVSFSCEKGPETAILGKNGSGKTTLFSILTGMTSGKGQFLLDGEDLMKNRRLRSQKVGFVPQSPPLIPELTGKDNLSLWYSKRDMERSLCDGVLALLGVGDFYRTPVHKMSGGMKKRLAIGCAVSHSPSVLLLDEPSAALDIVCRERIEEYLCTFRKGGGTVILSTHDYLELDSCDDLFVLRDGTVTLYDGDRTLSALAGLLG